MSAGVAAAFDLAVEVVDMKRPLHVPREADAACERGRHQRRVVVAAEYGQLWFLLHLFHSRAETHLRELEHARNPPLGGSEGRGEPDPLIGHALDRVRKRRSSTPDE